MSEPTRGPGELFADGRRPSSRRSHLTIEVNPAGPRASLDRVLKAFEAQGLTIQNHRLDSFMASCPVHDDNTPSLHVTWRRGERGGGVLLHCHGCQAHAEQIVEALGLTMTDLFDEPLPERDRSLDRVGKSTARRRAGQRRGKLGPLPRPITRIPAPVENVEHAWHEVDRYRYVNRDGELVQEVVRQECTAHGDRHKQFKQLFVGARRDGSAPAGFVPVLYRAPQVAEAVRTGVEVWVVEGEKDVHTAESLGLVATTNTQGGRAFPDHLVEEFRNARVVVVLDRDATGWARGVELHSKFTAVGATVSLRLPAVDFAKADLTDHVTAGHGIDELLAVSIGEITGRHALATSLGAAQSKAKSVDQAVREAYARHELAEAGEDPQDNERFATRWVLESQVRHEALRDLVDQVYAVASRFGTDWAGEAMRVADQLLSEATTAARRCHLDLGVPVPESLREPPPEPEIALISRSRTAAGEDDIDATSPVFRVFAGQIVEWIPPRADTNRGGENGKYKVLLSTVVRVTCREYLEEEDRHDITEKELLGRTTRGRKSLQKARTLMAVRLEYPDEVTGEMVEIRVPADQWHDHSWLETLPGHPDYDHKRAGLDHLHRAILAVSDTMVDQVLYRSTGWRENRDGTHRFIHHRGAITAAGHEDLEVAFSGPIERYDLPDPTRDPAVLRQAWLDASLTMLDRIPDRVTAPLLGQVFRAVLGHNPWVLTLVGPPGSYKTSVAAKAMHHFGEKWEHQKAASSMSGNGDTFNALRYKLHNAKDVLYWLDDFAPTKSWMDAQRLLEETARLIHNQEERSRSSRDGQSVSDGTAPRASGLCTSEVMPRPGSASERMLVVPLAKQDIDTDTLFPLDEPQSRYQRALVMASYISWLAHDLKAKSHYYATVAEEYADTLNKGDAQETVRQAAALANTWIGWVAVTDFLLDAGAITEDEREATLERIDIALREAGRAAVDPDMPRTTGARVRELLAYALRQGIAYVDDVRTGDCPPWPLAGRLGWRRTITDTDPVGNPLRTRLDRCGIRLGYVLHDPDAKERGRVLMCDSTQLEAVLKAASGTQAEKLEIDRNTACRALHEEGVLIPDDSEKGRVRHTVKCRIYTENRTVRMVALHLDRVIGPDDDVDDDRPDPPSPRPPRSTPGWTNPHGVDGSTPPAHAGTNVAHHSDATDGADHPSEDSHVQPPPFTSRQYTDRDGVVGWSEISDDVAPCVVCGSDSRFLIAGTRIHLPCWERSTATERGTTPPAAAGAPSVPPASPSTTVAEGFRAAAAVLDVDGIWLSNGEHLPMPGEGPTHAGDLVRLAQWLRLGTQTTKYKSAGGQVWVADRLAARLGIDVAAIQAAPEQDKDKVTREITKDLPLLTAALDAGYSIGGRDGNSLGRWTRIWKADEKSVWVVLLAAMSRDDAAVALMRDDPDHATLARRIGLLADALGFPYQLSGSTTGLDLMTSLRWKDREKFFAPHEPVPPAQQSNIEADISWSRKPTTEELTHDWVHAYDRSGSYLAGVSGLELGFGDPVYHPDGTHFVPKLPAYWRIEIPEIGDWRIPNLLDPRGGNTGKLRWVTTPGLEFAVEQGYDPQIVEAWTWPEHGRILDPWYERIRDARTKLDVNDPDAQAARDQLKQIYAPTIGMFGSHTHMAGRSGYAPEWRHLIISKARTNILRRVVKIGQTTNRWPVAIIADTVLYTSPDPDPVAAWPGGAEWLGRSLGKYKPEGSARLDTQLQYLTGEPYKGKDAILHRVRGSE